MGSTFNVIAEYTGPTDNQFAFSVTLQGGAGFNIDLKVAENPTMSGSVTTQLIASKDYNDNSDWVNIPIASGVSIAMLFTGLSSTVSGTGSATGSASFVAGLTGSASVGCTMPLGSSISCPMTKTFSYQAPTFTSTLELKTLNINAQITGSATFALNVLSWTVGIYYDVAMTESVDYTLSTSASSFIVSTIDSKHNSLRKTIDENVIYVPGSIIPITVTYNGFQAGEDIVMYASILKFNSEKETIERYRIHSEIFQNSQTGHGKFDAEWIVPWNLLYADNNAEYCVEIHMSNYMFNAVDSCSTSKFKISSFTDNDSIFEPLPDVIIIDQEYTLNWRKDLLSYYHVDKTNLLTGVGKLKESSEVEIYLIAEYDIDNSKSSINLNINNNIANSGSTKIIINTDIVNTLLADRYYFVVQSSESEFTHGWSSGTFQISSSTTINTLNIELIKKKNTDFKQNLRNSGSKSLFDKVNERNQKKRKLASCTNTQATLVTGSTAYPGSSVKMEMFTIAYPYQVTVDPIDLTDTSSCIGPTAANNPTAKPIASPTKAPTTDSGNKPSAAPTTASGNKPSSDTATVTTDSSSGGLIVGIIFAIIFLVSSGFLIKMVYEKKNGLTVQKFFFSQYKLGPNNLAAKDENNQKIELSSISAIDSTLTGKKNDASLNDENNQNIELSSIGTIDGKKDASNKV